MNKKYKKYIINTLHYGGLIVFILLMDGALGTTWGIIGGILWYSLFPAVLNLITHWDIIKTAYLSIVYGIIEVIRKWLLTKKNSKDKLKR